LGEQEPADAHEQHASPTLDERCKGGLDFAVAADIEDDELLPNGQILIIVVILLGGGWYGRGRWF
jgi:hypothetical protein